jgi:hypothetical protein
LTKDPTNVEKNKSEIGFAPGLMKLRNQHPASHPPTDRFTIGKSEKSPWVAALEGSATLN